MASLTPAELDELKEWGGKVLLPCENIFGEIVEYYCCNCWQYLDMTTTFMQEDRDTTLLHHLRACLAL